MRLESARDLKTELAAELRRSAQEAARFSTIRSSARSAASGGGWSGGGAVPLTMQREAERSVAVGIAPQSGGREFKLAIRVQNRDLLDSPLVDDLVRRASNEADVRYVGRVEKPTPTKTARAAAAEAAASAAWHQGNVRPLVVGASVGHFKVTAGTIGAFVQRKGKTYILSNNHVLANEGRAKRGDAVLQRGALDGGKNPYDRVALLDDWVKFNKGVNYVDAAVAELRDARCDDPGLLRGVRDATDHHLAGVGPEFLDKGAVVYKIGRTTGPSKGRITAFDLDHVVVTYDVGNRVFYGQMEIEGADDRAFGDRGDSGSLIVNDDLQAVGLLFATTALGGTNGKGLTYANQFGRVVAQLGVELLT